MSWLKNLKIGTKLGLGFGVLLALTAVLGGFALYEISKVNGNTVEIATNWLPSVQIVEKLQVDVAEFRRFELAHILSTDKNQVDKYETFMDDSLAKLAIDEKTYEPLISSEEERGLYEGFRSEWQKYSDVHAKVLELSRQNKNDPARDLALSDGFTYFTAASAKLADDVKLNSTGAQDAAKSAAGVYSQSRYWILGLLLASILLGVAIGTGIARSITSAATGMLRVIEQVAANNLAIADVEVTSRDEIGTACMALNTMKNNLARTVQSIAEAASHVASASAELSSTSQQIGANSEETSAQANVVSAAAEEVSKNLDTVATATEEMTASIKDIAKNAQEAAKIATSAVETAKNSNETITHLGESSSEIGQVLKVITSIAQQTNLLALNATIEAARAGEAGKGFAVVANEVKELAKETAKATEEISGKIVAIQQGTAGAVEAIHEIGGVIGQINSIANTIAVAVEEQTATTTEISRNVSEAASGGTEIAKNILDVANAAKNTAQGVTESQKASADLSRTAHDLNAIVSQFQLNDNARGGGSAASRREPLATQRLASQPA